MCLTRREKGLFLDIDKNKKPKRAKYFLAKPNREVISHIFEKSDDEISLKLGNINELKFSIPFSIDDGVENIENKHINLIKEKMLIKMDLNNQIEWFIVDSIEESGDDSEMFNVVAFSLGYELSGKRIPIFQENSISIRDATNKLLSRTLWRVKTVDAKFEQLFRSFDISDSNVLDCLLQVAETFGAVVIWDTNTREISFIELENIGTFKGMSINYGSLLQSLNRTRSTDELVTRLYIEGNEGLAIHSVNPTGQSYIEDFSFFMYPFERDESKNTIKSSYYMSDALCHAILDHEKIILENSPKIKELVENQLDKQSLLVAKESELETLKDELENILDRLDVAKATEDTELISQIEVEKSDKESEIVSKESIVNSLITEIENIVADIDALQSQIFIESNFTQDLLDELNPYIIEKIWRDDRYIDAQELYDDGLEKFSEMKKPKVVITVDIENLFEIVDEQYYWDKLNIGDLIKIKYPQMNIQYMAKIVEITCDFEGGGINITIANTKDIGSEMDEIKDILYNSKTASTILSNSKYKWDKTPFIEDDVYKLLNSEWDANKNMITAGINNQIEIGKRGIIIKNPDTPNDVVIMQSGIIALSNDGGLNWKTAVKPDGIVAERLIGNIIAGRNLIITNGDNSFTFDSDGFRVKSNKFIIESEGESDETFDSYKARIEQSKDRINLVVSSTDEIKGYEIASAISIDPEALKLVSSEIDLKAEGEDIVSGINILPDSIKIDSKNVDIVGAVTFSSFDGSMQSRFSDTESDASNASSTIDGWKMAGKTTINGANIETGTISASKIKTDELIVGTNVSMGSGAYISWNNITSKPSIPQNASDVGAISNTYIDSSGVWTGYINADRITSGTISASKISGGTISGVSINIDTDATLGNNLYLGTAYAGSSKMIVFNSEARISADTDGTLKFSAEKMHVGYGSVYVAYGETNALHEFNGEVDFSNATITGLDVTAKFG
jgi:phage minor structural protein